MSQQATSELRVLIIGSGSDAEAARELAATAEIAVGQRWSTKLTHLIVDDTVKPSEPRIKKAEEAGIPVLDLDGFRRLTGGDGDTEAEAAEATETADAEVAVIDEAAADVADTVTDEPATEIAETSTVVEPAAVEDSEPTAAVLDEPPAPNLDIPAQRVEVGGDDTLEPVAAAVVDEPAAAQPSAAAEPTAVEAGPAETATAEPTTATATETEQPEPDAARPQPESASFMDRVKGMVGKVFGRG